MNEFEEQGEEQDNVRPISMTDLIWNLPLFDNLFLSMQGQNIMMIDFFLRDQEMTLLRDLVDQERTPSQTTFVSALSQMWIFAAYELLRTWRQFVADLKKQAARSTDQGVTVRDQATDLAALYREGHLAEFRTSESFRKNIDEANARVEPVFRRIEALRMNLAKHEVPKSRGELAMAPGYGRIDGSNGSIYWMVDLGSNEVDMVSRRSLSVELRRAVIGRSLTDDDHDEEEDSF